MANEVKRYPGWKVVFLGIMLMNFGYSCIVSIVGAFMNPVSSDLGVQIGDFGIWITINSITAFFVLLVASKYYSAKTLKPMLLIGAISGIIGFVGFANAQSLTMIYCFAVFLGLCFALVSTTPCALMVNNWYGPKLRGKYLGIVFGVNSLCVMFIIPIMNTVIQMTSWRVAYYILAACLAICIPLILKFAVWSPDMVGVKRIGDYDADELAGETELEGYEFKEGLKKPIVWVAFITGLLLVIASSSVLAYTQPCIEAAGYSSTIGSSAVSIAIGLTVVTCIWVGRLCDKAGVHIGTLVTGIAFVLAFLFQIIIPNAGMPMIVLFVLAYGFGSPAVNVVTPLIVNFLCGEKNASAFIGYANMFIAIGGALGSFIVGQLVNATGGFLVPFLFCAALLAIMTAMRWTITLPRFRFKKDSEETTAVG